MNKKTLVIKNIRNDEGTLQCDFFLNCAKGTGKIRLSAQTGQLKSVTYPQGQRNCDRYLVMPIKYLQESINNEEFPEEKVFEYYNT